MKTLLTATAALGLLAEVAAADGPGQPLMDPVIIEDEAANSSSGAGVAIVLFMTALMIYAAADG